MGAATFLLSTSNRLDILSDFSSATKKIQIWNFDTCFMKLFEMSLASQILIIFVLKAENSQLVIISYRCVSGLETFLKRT